MADWTENTKQLNEAIKAIKEKYEPRIQALQQKGGKLREDAPKPEAIEAMINVDFEVTWKDVDLIFDLPSVTMKEQTISFDLPEVTTTLQTMSWDRPSVCMVYKEFPWGGGFHVPEPCMKREEIKIEVPEFTMKTQEIIMHLPEFTMERVYWKLGLPQITIKNVKVETEKLKERGDELQREGDAIAADMKKEVDRVVAQVYGSVSDVKERFDSALVQLNNSIESAVGHGLDPIKLPAGGGDINLRKMYAELIEKRDATVAQIVAGQGANEGKPLVRLEEVAA